MTARWTSRLGCRARHGGLGRAGLALLSAVVRVLFGLLSTVAQAAGTSSVPSSVWITDGMVNSVLPAGKLLYVGGRFTSIGPYTGGGVPVSLTGGGAGGGGCPHT